MPHRRQKDRQTDRQTETDRQTDIQSSTKGGKKQQSLPGGSKPMADHTCEILRILREVDVRLCVDIEIWILI